MPLALTTRAFQNEHEIPVRFTCDGDDVPPALTISGVPEGTKSLALIVDDPDAPAKVWVHWVVVDLPPDCGGVGEGHPLPAGAREGMNDSHQQGWGGPCPPPGKPHRYYFKLYALDKTLPELPHPTKAQVEKAMHGHVLAQAQWMGTYQRQR